MDVIVRPKFSTFSIEVGEPVYSNGRTQVPVLVRCNVRRRHLTLEPPTARVLSWESHLTDYGEDSELKARVRAVAHKKLLKHARMIRTKAALAKARKVRQQGR